ncbi:MAG: serine peptidase, partial [Deltaproteobacteria bacterium]|nr:serine peptidase [Deltaproteobacteria bacterium]
MNPSAIPGPNAPQKRRVLSARRVILLATTIASLGAAALLVAPGLNLPNGYPASLAQNLTEQAQKVATPVGFADVVEKVKPAVISVRVKMNGGSQTEGLGNENMQNIPPGLREFFRRFGTPDGQNGPGGMMPRGRGGHNNIITGQGSGFFISADGYAVTNN